MTKEIRDQILKAASEIIQKDEKTSAEVAFIEGAQWMYETMKNLPVQN